MFEDSRFLSWMFNRIARTVPDLHLIEVAFWIANYLSDTYIQELPYLGRQYKTSEEFKEKVLNIYKDVGVYNKSFCKVMIVVALMGENPQPRDYVPSFFLIHEDDLTPNQIRTVKENLGVDLINVDENIKQLKWEVGYE